MELKFIDSNERVFWEKSFRTFVKRGYGYSQSIEYADKAVLDYRKREF